jgi:hypothetical protein
VGELRQRVELALEHDLHVGAALGRHDQLLERHLLAAALVEHPVHVCGAAASELGLDQVAAPYPSVYVLERWVQVRRHP